MISCTHIDISARRGPAWVAQSVTALPPSARDRLAEEMETAEQLASLLVAIARAVVQQPPTEAGVTVDQQQPEDEAADG
jgi:hypothetical protein